ncbi:MAG: hypothetical protein ACOYK6_06325 [Chthoniobacterales bacterium]
MDKLKPRQYTQVEQVEQGDPTIQDPSPTTTKKYPGTVGEGSVTARTGQFFGTVVKALGTQLKEASSGRGYTSVGSTDGSSDDETIHPEKPWLGQTPVGIRQPLLENQVLPHGLKKEQDT